MEFLETSEGVVEYTLTRKSVKNLNLRVRTDGRVLVSAPFRMPRRSIEGFIRLKAAWIFQTRAKMQAKPPPAPGRYSNEECLALFTRLSDEIFPLFSELLGGKKPTIKVREMKSRWGVCNIRTRCLTFNTRLAEKPLAVAEYVVLHEYVHFLHPNHQAGFHAEMARLMPDYLQRRKLLRE